MHNFFRAVALIFRRPLAAVLSVVCSLGVAVMWGGNIGVLYPVMEVALRGKSIQAWQGDELRRLHREVTKIDQQIGAAPSEQRRQALEEEKTLAAAQIAASRQMLRFAQVLPNDAFQTVLVFVCLVLAMTVLKQVFLVGNYVATTWCVQQVTVQLQTDYMGHVAQLDMENYDRFGVSRLVTTFTESLEHVSRGVNILIGTSIREPLKMAACCVGAALISWRMLVLTLVAAPLAALLIAALARWIQKTTTSQLNHSIHLNKLVFEAIRTLPLVQAFTMEQPVEAEVEAAAGERMRRSIKTSFLVALTKPVVEILGIASISIALLCGAYLVLNQETRLLGVQVTDRPLSVGMMLTFFGLLIGMTEPARKLSETFNVLQISCAAANSLYGVIDTPTAVAEPAQPAPLPETHQRIELRGVDFAYNEPLVLRDITMSVNAGETMALVGANGSGKSTLAKLLLRFYDPNSGAIELDGVDLRDASLEALRSRIAVVPQRAVLLSDTVANNIRFGNPMASMDQVVEAAKRASADEFIEQSLTDGYETHIGHDGQRLSGGQRQRLALARAILRDPQILILDEATSQIDPRSESLLRAALREYVANRTCLIITHRRTFLDLADRIVMLEEGRVIADGPAETIAATCREFDQLFNEGDEKAA